MTILWWHRTEVPPTGGKPRQASGTLRLDAQKWHLTSIDKQPQSKIRRVLVSSAGGWHLAALALYRQCGTYLQTNEAATL